MNLLRQALTIARIEFGYFARYPKLLLAAAIVVLIPALYVLIYLVSVWDPAANTGALTVAIVNQDEGMTYQEKTFNIGEDVVTRLKASGRFGFKEFHDENEARRLVREGKLVFALIIPPQFSSNAIPGILVGAGKPVIYVSEGNNYESAAMAAHFAEILGQQINESLNEKRWAMVLASAVGSQQSVAALRAGVARLNHGAHELSSGAVQTAEGTKTLVTGSNRLNEGVGQLTAGVKQLDNGLRLMDSHRPTNTELNQLKIGADKLAAGNVELRQGMGDLKAGSQQLLDGIQQFQSEASASLWAPTALTDGLRSLNQGVTKLDAGIATAGEAQGALTDGADQLGTGVGKLVSGIRTLGNGIHSMVVRLPLNSQLDQLNSGAEILASGASKLENANQSVAKGAQMLAMGLDELQRSLPGNITKPDGSPEGLAHSVEPIVERVANVENNGSGFAPNVIPMALWLGAGIVIFLLHVRVLPLEAEGFAAPAQMLGKVILPSALVLVQALVVMLAARFILKVEVVHPGAFALTIGVASVSFLLISFALARAFGDAGKALGMVLLAVQLASSSAIMPVELSGKLFMTLSPWLPLTWVVKALKASMFGAFDSVWHTPLLYASLSGAVAFVMGCTIGKWRFDSSANTRPAIEL
ncbi:YhgE/Pip domain-containing protein [Uliginosibacterium sp. H3]|uniref:YhgE/Pip domain-containing protein n=1 Tax=Uliginosibacterium silvisoli TaxID=3114758 RepID=A0ABU6JY62_9RHOO|nr:YhgE/Pip domain-containing protein [Uliginosibacterium sp. H3]